MDKNAKGRAPASLKGAPSSDLKGDYQEPNLLKLDPELRRELEGKGLTWRFINARQYSEKAGFHRSGWKVYKREAKASQGSLDFEFGSDPEGYVRRGDLVLAVKPNDVHDQHRAAVRERTRRYNGYARRQADELRQMAQEAGSRSQVYEGYEETEASDQE